MATVPVKNLHDYNFPFSHSILINRKCAYVYMGLNTSFAFHMLYKP